MNASYMSKNSLTFLMVYFIGKKQIIEFVVIFFLGHIVIKIILLQLSQASNLQRTQSTNNYSEIAWSVAHIMSIKKALRPDLYRSTWNGPKIDWLRFIFQSTSLTLSLVVLFPNPSRNNKYYQLKHNNRMTSGVVTVANCLFQFFCQHQVADRLCGGSEIDISLGGWFVIVLAPWLKCKPHAYTCTWVPFLLPACNALKYLVA